MPKVDMFDALFICLMLAYYISLFVFVVGCIIVVVVFINKVASYMKVRLVNPIEITEAKENTLETVATNPSDATLKEIHRFLMTFDRVMKKLQKPTRDIVDLKLEMSQAYSDLSSALKLQPHSTEHEVVACIKNLSYFKLKIVEKAVTFKKNIALIKIQDNGISSGSDTDEDEYNLAIETPAREGRSKTVKETVNSTTHIKTKKKAKKTN